MANAIKSLPVASVQVRPEYQQRQGGIVADWVDELAEVLKAGEEFREKPVVYRDGTAYVLAGGFHRHAAYGKAGMKKAPYEVRESRDRLAPLKYALGDNAEHGLRRTTADKRKAVTTAIQHPQLGKLSDREIDRLCRVSDGYTSKLRKELTGATPDPVKSTAAKIRNQGTMTPEPEGQEAASPEPTPTPAENPHPEPSTPIVRAGHVVTIPKESVIDADAVAAERKPEPIEEACDHLGRPLPQRLIPIFDLGEKVLKVAREAQALQRSVAELTRESTFGEAVNRNSFIKSGLKLTVSGLSDVAAFCVCPACAAEPGHCPTCTGRGWLTKPQYLMLPEPMAEEAEQWAAEKPRREPVDPAKGLGFTPPGPGRDGKGNPIPKRLRDVFEGSYELASLSQHIKSLAHVVQSHVAWAVWLKPTISEKLKWAADEIQGSRPFAVCEKCEGKGCASCLTGGYLPLAQKEEIMR